MGPSRNFPGGTVGWTGSTMRENLQEDCFMPCDSRLVAVNVGPDGSYGSLVFDTNQSNQYDSGRSAFLQSAFRVIKKPNGVGYNAIGFQLYLSGNKDTKGGFFVDQGDGSSTTQGTPTGGAALGGSGMVASGMGQAGGAVAPQTTLPSFSTSGAGSSGGIVIGQGSFNDGGPFHVGNKKDKHNKGKDADGTPINSLHIATTGNYYKNQIEDGPLRFEDIYQQGQDQSIIVPVHLGWAGSDWAWWTTSYFYQPPSPYPYNPYNPPGTVNPTPTPGPNPNPTPTPGPPGHGNYNPTVNPTPTPGPNPNPTPGPPGHGNYNPDVSTGGSDGGTPLPGDGGAGGSSAPNTGGSTSTLTPDDVGQIGQPGPWNDVPEDPSAGFQNGLVPVMGATQGGDGTLINPYPGSGGQGPSTPIDPGAPPLPPDFDLPFTPGTTFFQMGSSSLSGDPISFINSTLPISSQAGGFQAQNYNQGALADPMFSGADSGDDAQDAIDKSGDSSPQVGTYSSYGAQGGDNPAAPAPSPGPAPSPSPSPSPSPTPTPATQTGALGDPFVYTSSPKGTQMTGKQMSRYPNGTATGGIVYHPPETDLRDTPVGLVPSNVNLSTMSVVVGPNAYFGCGVPSLVTGGIQSGYQFGLDPSTGDLVFYSVSFSQAKIEAMRFTNSSQRIRWRSTEGFYGELGHTNTGNRSYFFPDRTGTVHVGIATVPSGGGATATNGTIGGSGPASATMSMWEQITRNDGTLAWVQTWV